MDSGLREVGRSGELLFCLIGHALASARQLREDGSKLCHLTLRKHLAIASFSCLVYMSTNLDLS